MISEHSTHERKSMHKSQCCTKLNNMMASSRTHANATPPIQGISYTLDHLPTESKHLCDAENTHARTPQAHEYRNNVYDQQ